MLPIPRSYEAQGVRQYGFHGLSYEFLVGELGRLAGLEAAKVGSSLPTLAMARALLLYEMANR